MREWLLIIQNAVSFLVFMKQFYLTLTKLHQYSENISCQIETKNYLQWGTQKLGDVKFKV